MSKMPQRIAALRLEKRMSQAELGSVMGVTRSSVQQWEAGKTVPQLHHLAKMADFFGVSVAVILGDDTTDKSIDAALRVLPKDVSDALKASFLATIEAVKKSRN
jgi:transcriptional regulator with XRE-family HTH domain